MARIIKRYENRKLYDSKSRKYISLEQIGTLIREGVDVRVIDKATDEDITAHTLTQVILEDGKKGEQPLSTETLHGLIRWGNSVIDDGLRQVKEGIDHLVPDAVTRLFNKPEKPEIDALQERIEALEATINNMANKVSEQALHRRKPKNPGAK